MSEDAGYPEKVTVSRGDLAAALSFVTMLRDEPMPVRRLRETVAAVRHETPGGGENAHITIGDNQDPDCFSIYQENRDGSDWDVIHVCDWPALKAAINRHQAERGSRLA